MKMIIKILVFIMCVLVFLIMGAYISMHIKKEFSLLQHFIFDIFVITGGLIGVKLCD